MEIVSCKERGEYLEIQCAIDNVLAVPMDVHKSAREQYPTEPAWIQYLTRCADSLIKVFGDARYPRRIDPEQFAATA
jgi:hypothetical protein